MALLNAFDLGVPVTVSVWVSDNLLPPTFSKLWEGVLAKDGQSPTFVEPNNSSSLYVTVDAAGVITLWGAVGATPYGDFQVRVQPSASPQPCSIADVVPLLGSYDALAIADTGTLSALTFVSGDVTASPNPVNSPSACAWAGVQINHVLV